MTEVRVEGIHELNAKLDRFKRASVLSEVTDTVRPSLLAALRLASPKITGKLASSIRARRETSISGIDPHVNLIATSDVPYARFVLEGTRAHDIYPNQAQALHWMNQMGDSVFSKVVHHPGTRANDFPDRVWRGMREMVMAEMAAQIRRKLGEPV